MSFTVLLILFSCFTLLFSIYTKFQFEDDKGISESKWHPWGADMRIMCVVIPMITALFPPQFLDWVVVSIVQMPWWDVCINIIALHVKALYLGTSAKTDQLKAKKWLLYLIALIAAILVKIFFKFSNDDLLNLIHRI